MEDRDRITPGQVWLDTDGNRIQAHGGSMFYENGTYYWYGENKEKTIPGSGIWHWGVRCYSSKDLYKWKNEGIIIPPEPDDPNSQLNPSRYVDRPHILYNERTGKYVCWLKFAGTDVREHCFTILTSEHLLGPYEIRVNRLFPAGKAVGDFDLIKDEETGKAYLYAETDIVRISCFTLTDDYCGVTEELSEHLERGYREGPALFVRNGLHYMITSGRTGYLPNPSQVAAAKDWHGPFENLGNPHRNDYDESSFNSQISCVFKVPGKDLYIAMADRWVPDYPVTRGMSKKIWGIITDIYLGRPVPEADKKWFDSLPMMDGVNTSIANYVWLPVRFEGDMPVIEWHDSWRVEDYE